MGLGIDEEEITESLPVPAVTVIPPPPYNSPTAAKDTEFIIFIVYSEDSDQSDEYPAVSLMKCCKERWS